nr:hypothetical protein CR513_00322 [Ipomoea batatas]
MRLPADNRPLLLRRSSAPGEITELPHHQNILRKLRFHTVLKRPKAFQGVERRGLPWERDDEVVDAQLSGGAVHADVGGHIGEERAVESGDSPVFPFHRSPAGENDPRFVHLRVAQRRDGFRELVVVGPQNRADAVPAGVAQRSQPVQIWLHADAKRIREELFHLSSSRMMHPRGSIHELNPTGRTRRQNLVQLRHVQRHRLLQQHVLLLLRRQDGPPHVEAGGERDVNGVHVRVVQHGVVAAVNFRGGGALGLCDKRRRLLRRAAADGGDCRVWSQRYSPGQIARHGGTAQYSETDLPLLSHFSRQLRSTLNLYMQPLKGNIYKGKKGSVCLDCIHHQLRFPADNRPLLLRRSSAPGEITELPHHQRILRELGVHNVLSKARALDGVEGRGVFRESEDEVVDAQLSGGAVNADVGGHIGHEGAVESGDSPVLPFHRSAAGENDPRFVHLRVAHRRDGFREFVVDRPQDCSDAVPAGVAQRSQPVQIWLHADYLFGTYGFELAKADRIREELFHLSSSRMMHPHGTIHVLDPTGLTRRQNLVQLRHVQRRRLLHQHVLLLLRRQEGPPHVQAGGERDVNGVHVRIIQHGVVAAVNFRGGRALVLRGKRGGLLRRAAAHGGDGRVRSQRYSSDQLARHAGTAQICPSPEIESENSTFEDFTANFIRTLKLRFPADNRPLLLRRTSAPGEITEFNHHQNILRKIRFHAVLNKPIAFQGVERRRLFRERDDEVVDAQLSGGPGCAAGENGPGFVHLRVGERPAKNEKWEEGMELTDFSWPRRSSRMMHPRGSIHVLDPTGLTRRQNPVQLRHVQRRRILHQHVLLLLRRQDGPPHVQAGGESDVNGVHVRIIQHGVVAAVKFRGGRALVLGGKRRGLLRRAAANGGDGRVRSLRYSPGQVARYGGAAQYSETDLPLLCHFFRRTPRGRLQRAESSCFL